MADSDWFSTMADIYSDLLPNLAAFSLRDKETGETNLNNVIYQDSIDVIAHLEESPEDRALVQRAVPWDCRRDLHDGIPCFLRYLVEGDFYVLANNGDRHQSICDNPKCREDFEKPLTQEEFLAGLGIASASSSDMEQHEFQAAPSAMADYYEYYNTTSVRAGDIDQYKYNPATSTTVNECQCGNDHDPMYLKDPVFFDVDNLYVSTNCKVSARNFETAVENTSARASDMEHHECNAETSAIEVDIEGNDEDVSDIMSQCTCSQSRKTTSGRFLQCHCNDPRYIGPGVDAYVQNEEKDCLHIIIKEFETDMDKTADNVDDANAKVVIEVPQDAANEGIRAQQNNRHSVIRQFINNFQDHDRIRRIVQVQLPGSEELRELEKRLLMSLLKSLILLLFLDLTMKLLKKYDSTLDNFFSCFAYYGCYYLGGTLVACICGDAFIKYMEFFIKQCASKWKRLFVQVNGLALIMLWTFLIFNFLGV